MRIHPNKPAQSHIPASHGGKYGTKNPNPQMIDFSSNVNPLGCHPGVKRYLKKQLEIINPRLIVALGRIAACTILKTKEPLNKLRNQIFKYQGRPIKDPARSAWRKARRDCGLSDFRFHDLRHTWTSRGVKKGLTEAQLAYLGGWKSTRMVRHYTNLNDLKISDLPGY